MISQNFTKSSPEEYHHQANQVLTLIQSFNSLVALQNIIYNPVISESLPGTRNLKTNTIINDQDEFDFDDLDKFEKINSLLDEQLNPQK